MNRRSRVLKRLVDLVIAVPTIVLLSPVLGLVALAIRWRLGSPVLFRQQRPGLHGKPFQMLKFRTMTDARDRAGNLRSDAERMTRLGRFLRQTSLDELPELWNVVRGDMSLVGPRPLLMQYLERYTRDQMRRHDVLPGVTGWAQVNGRNAIAWERKFELDVWYVDHWSLFLDLKILVLTLLSVVRREGIQSEGHATAPEFVNRAVSVHKPIAIIGAGGHAKVVIDALRASGRNELALYDDDPGRWGERISGVEVVGPIRRLRGDSNQQAVIAIGDCARRAALASELSCRWISVIHPTAVVAETAVIGDGTVVMAGAVIQPGSRIGQHVIVNTAAIVDHDCQIGDFAHLAPGSCMAGGVQVGAQSLCGIGSAVLPGVYVGDRVILGAGAVAVKDIPSFCTAIGIPARVARSAREAA